MTVSYTHLDVYKRQVYETFNYGDPFGSVCKPAYKTVPLLCSCVHTQTACCNAEHLEPPDGFSPYHGRLKWLPSDISGYGNSISGVFQLVITSVTISHNSHNISNILDSIQKADLIFSGLHLRIMVQGGKQQPVVSETHKPNIGLTLRYLVRFFLDLDGCFISHQEMPFQQLTVKIVIH